MREKYQWYKHHAWAGLAILSIVVVLRSIFFIPDWLFVAVAVVLVIYIIFSLIGTYRYSGDILRQREDKTKTKDNLKIEKARLKLEKKKAKALYKMEKKRNKGN